MDSKKEARPAVGSKRATDPKIYNSLSRAVKSSMAREEAERWERMCRLLPVPFAAMLAAYALMLACGVGA